MKIPILIPSYHRPENIKTAKFFIKNGLNPNLIYVFVDSESDDLMEYQESTKKLGINLVVFDMNEARERYDYIHRPSPARRSAGQARNMFQDFALKNGLEFYCVIDDDTNNFEYRKFGKYNRKATAKEIFQTFEEVEKFMRKYQIGLFGLSQTGDMFEKETNVIIRKKVMNTSFYLMPYVYRGERGVQDNDTSLFTGIMNEGLFTGSLRSGIVLQQTPSAVAKGGLTDLYNECKLLNKSLVVAIQYPSAVRAEKQIRNGGRLHHRINYRYLMPCIIKGERSNIEWNSYPEDYPFTNEPKRNRESQNINTPKSLKKKEKGE